MQEAAWFPVVVDQLAIKQMVMKFRS